MGRRWWRLIAASLSVWMLLLACGPSSTAQPAPGSGGADQPARGGAKTMVMATSTEPAHLGPFQVVGTGYQGPVYQLVHDFLVVHDHEGQPHPHLAAELPSRERGTWQIFPDGTMETTWRLRPGAKWHDGTPLTAQDLVLAWRVANHADVPISRPAYANRIRDVSTPDPQTLVMHWSETYPFADRPEETVLDPLPTHLLAASFAGDVQGFVNSPYWTREFIGLGPYRLVSWREGSQIELAAVSDHYAGRAKLDTITVRFIPDPNTLMANLLSGTVDANFAPTDLDYSHWNLLEQQWPEGQVLYDKHGTFRFVAANHRVPPFGDVRVRRALAHGVDRAGVVDALFVPHAQIADGMVVPGSDRARMYRDRIQVYPYDPARARALLAEAGWRAGADGTARNAAGQPLDFEFRSTDETLGTVVNDMWKTVGLSPNLLIPGQALMRDREWQANVKGVESSGFGLGIGTWERRMHSSAIPVPDNRWAGTNRRFYSNAEVDALIDRLNTALDGAERDRIEGELLERVTRDAVLAPIYVDAPASVFRKGITGPKSMAGSPIIVSRYYGTWNILEWDRS